MRFWQRAVSVAQVLRAGSCSVCDLARGGEGRGGRVCAVRPPHFVLQLFLARLFPTSRSKPGGRARPALLGINVMSD